MQLLLSGFNLFLTFLIVGCNYYLDFTCWYLLVGDNIILYNITMFHVKQIILPNVPILSTFILLVCSFMIHNSVVISLIFKHLTGLISGCKDKHTIKKGRDGGEVVCAMYGANNQFRKKFQKEKKFLCVVFVGLILRPFLCVVSAFSMFIGIVVHFVEQNRLEGLKMRF